MKNGIITVLAGAVMAVLATTVSAAEPTQVERVQANAAPLRPGNVHSADGWDGVLKPVVARYQGKLSRIYFRGDADFAMPEVYEFLDAERIKYAIRLPANQVLQSRIGYLLTRPVGRPPHPVRRFHANFSYQAGTWTAERSPPTRCGSSFMRSPTTSAISCARWRRPSRSRTGR